MKRRALIVIRFVTLMGCLLTTPFARAEATSLARLRAYAQRQDQRNRVEGLNYMAGGGLGLVSALALDLASKEPIPKIGYGVIEVLSSAAISYGAILYFVGDDFTQQIRTLEEIERQLTPARGLTATERTRILNEVASNFIQREREKRRRIRLIRGSLELTTAASAGLSLAFSKVGGTSSNIVLGFILFVSTAGGLNDLLGSNENEGLSLTAWLPPSSAAPGMQGLALNYRW